MAGRNQKLIEARKHLSGNDRALGKVIQEVGDCRFRLEKNRFAMLVRSVTSQQLSTKVARTINSRLMDLVDQKLYPETVQRLSIKKIRTAGLSERKAECLKALSKSILKGEIPLENIGRLENEEVISRLTVVKGIGEWTAHMFLIFSLGRFDVVPQGDYGVRAAIQRIYKLDELPGKKQVHEIAENWHPNPSIASWYCWRFLELKD